MTIGARFIERYQTGDTPWDAGRPDFNLVEVVTQRPVLSCRALEIGCGTGDNAIWLAERRFQVVGVDISEVALAKAREKAAQAKVACEFVLADFLRDRVEGAPFEFVFDRGCFHSFDAKRDRKRYVRNVAASLVDGGLWLTIAGNADACREGLGPPQLTAGDIVSATEPAFEVLSLVSSHFGSHNPNPHRAWRCLLRKRQPA